MSSLDFLVYIFGVYGLSWLITQSAILFEPRDWIMSKSNFMDSLLGCIVCTSVWVSAFFVFFYFPAELWFTKILVIGTTVTTTWILANLLQDVD